eukprot:scaffold229946_cov28-Tisochrysis_lutea.AAC.1
MLRRGNHRRFTYIGLYYLAEYCAVFHRSTRYAMVLQWIFAAPPRTVEHHEKAVHVFSYSQQKYSSSPNRVR